MKYTNFSYFRNNFPIILNVLFVIFVLLLPYLIFEGKVYLGGDDTKLFYSYPLDFMKHVGPFSWYHFSSLGWYNPIQFEIPFLLFWSGLEFIIPSKTALSYLAFSLPMIVGFVYFQKFLKELVLENNEKYPLAYLFGSLFFIFSPIIMINQLFNFLSTVWLLGLVPIELYYFIRYLKTSRFMEVFKAMIFTTVFSIALFSIPWLLGFAYVFLPALFIGAFLFSKKEIFVFVKRMSLFVVMIAFSQAYWLFGFLMSYVNLSTNSFASKVVSQEFLDTFTPVVVSTAVGTIIYPLLNLFHRQIAFNFVWDLKTVFLSFYDNIFLLNFLFPLVLFMGLIGYKKFLISKERKIFIIILIGFILSLYFFTVNIGPLKELFLNFRIVPGFVALRNFYDKFAFVFVLSYAMLITYGLVVICRKYDRLKKIIILFFPLVVLINFYPVDRVVDSPLWGTKSTYRAIQIPDEYMSFMDEVGDTVSASNNILSVPFGSSIYTVIKDKDTNNAYVGSSPVIVFSGVNDISGHMSFNFTDEAHKVDKILIEGDTDRLKEVMFKHNINYVIHTKNIPDVVKKAQWIFDPLMIENQDEKFLNNITEDKILTSSDGNYELYSVSSTNTLIKSKNVYFQRLSPVKVKVYIKNLKGRQEIEFNDSFHDGWKLFPVEFPSLSFCKELVKHERFKTIECAPTLEYGHAHDLSYIFSKPISDDSHELLNNFSNKWSLDSEEIKKSYNENYYKINPDGSMDVEMVLYFQPQVYFYYGLLMSSIVFIGSIIYLIRINSRK